MSHEGYHEPVELLTEETKDLHRAIISLMEELEAIDWYQQRADVCQDLALKAVLMHNRNEEVEHGMMVLEWIRRRDGKFDEFARKYMFTDKDIVQIEEEADAANEIGADKKKAESPPASTNPSLGIGGLRSV